jgi:hypothetical protein
MHEATQYEQSRLTVTGRSSRVQTSPVPLVSACPTSVDLGAAERRLVTIPGEVDVTRLRKDVGGVRSAASGWVSGDNAVDWLPFPLPVPGTASWLRPPALRRWAGGEVRSFERSVSCPSVATAARVRTRHRRRWSRSLSDVDLVLLLVIPTGRSGPK